MANDLFIVADPRQRIYHSPIDLRDCGIELDGRIHRLQINYRTTEQIRSWATARTPLSATNDLGGSGLRDLPTHSLLEGPEPKIVHSDDWLSESLAIVDLISKLATEYALEEIAIVVRTNRLRNALKKQLQSAEIKYQVLDQKGVTSDGVCLATMHRVKGLEFRCVVIAGLGKDAFPTKYRGRENNHSAMKRHLNSERNLLYVAATRARDRLILSTHGDGFSWP